MITTSDLYKSYVELANRELEAQAIIGGVVYGSDEVVEFTVEDMIAGGDELTIGTVIPAKLSMQLKTTSVISTNAKIVPEIRLNGSEGYTEWIPMGEFYIDSRKYQNGVWSFECVDKLITTEQPYVSSLTYPASMALVFEEICTILSIDSDVVINPAFQIPYKDETISIREMLSCIASAHGANIKLNRAGELVFVPLSANLTPVATITASNYIRAEQTNPQKTYTKLQVVHNSEGDTLELGTGEADNTLKFENRFMFIEQNQFNNAFSVMNGFSYVPFNISWMGRLDLDVGDVVKIVLLDGTEITSIIAINKISFKGGLLQQSSAPSKSEQQSEFRFQGNLSKQIQQKITKDVPYYGVSFGPSQGIKITQSEGKSEAVFNADTFAMRALDGGTMKDKIYFDPVSGKYVFDGELSANVIEALEANFDVEVSNTVIVQNLYSEYGRVAKLSVSELDTSWRKITNYLNGDKSDVNYIRIYEKYMKWITATTDGVSTVQVTDIDGNLLYWVDNTHKGMTLNDTGLPVLMYEYTETVKFEMTFETEYPQAVKMTFGTGFGYENPNEGKGFIYKDADGILMKYIQAGGNVLEIRLGENGIIQSGTGVKGLRNISVSSTPPALPQVNDLWIDTSV